MVNFDDPNQIEIVNFTLPFSGRLNAKNKWIRLAKMIPCSNGTPLEGRAGWEVHQEDEYGFWAHVNQAPDCHWCFDYQAFPQRDVFDTNR